ncbi:maternal effect embryo arrest 60 [Actinidia rufa]|uniref:Maternal effect embryo arrest 60 n=1 Tax=Actinidia rufa TaxID=165716 RepID=A0A7J0H9Q4_9ERIC|nr:maternal effect embryo arrest 60 [Actinidia rufa]
MTLDGIVTVNSLFTMASFLGLTLNPTDPNYTLVDPTAACVANSATAEHLVAFHVYSFSSFLFSSLVASALKQAIRMAKGGELHGAAPGHISLRALQAGIMASAMGASSGCIFLMLALVDLVQIKLGSWGWYSLAAIGPLVVLVPSALVIYICIVLHAFTR